MDISFISRGDQEKVFPDQEFQGDFTEFAGLFKSYNPERGKHDGYFVRGKLTGRRNNDNLPNASLIILDGDQSKDNENSAPDPHPLHNALMMANISHFIYTTHSYDPTINKFKWRCVIPCEMEDKRQLKPTLKKLFAFLDGIKYPLVNVKENWTWSQPWFLPNRAKDDGHYIYLTHLTGEEYEAASVEESEAFEETKTAENSHFENLKAIRDGISYYKELQDVIWGMVRDGRTKEAVVCDVEMIMLASKASQSDHEHNDKWQSRFDEINTYVNQAWDKAYEDEEDSIPIIEERQEIFRELQWPPGRIGELAQEFYDMAPYPNKEMSIIGAICLIAGITGRHYNVLGTGLNIYATLLANSGMGKSIIKDGVSQALITSDAQHAMSYLGPARFTGPKALFNSLVAGMSKVCIFEESGLMNSSKAGDQDGLTRVVLEAYSSSGRGKVLGGEAYSDKENSLKMLQSPALSIINVSTPKSYLMAMKNKSAEVSGEIARIWMTRTMGDKPYYNKDRSYAFSKHHLDRIGELMKECAPHQDPENFGEKIVDIKIKNKDHFDDEMYWTDQYNEFQRTHDSLRMALASRAWLKSIKLSAVCSVYNGLDHVGDEEYDWARKAIQEEISFVSDTFRAGDGDSVASACNAVVAPMISKMLRAALKNDKAVPSNALRKIGAFTYSNINQALRRNTTLLDMDDTSDRSNPKSGLQKVLDYMVNSGFLYVMKPDDVKKYAKRASKVYRITPDFAMIDVD